MGALFKAKVSLNNRVLEIQSQQESVFSAMSRLAVLSNWDLSRSEPPVLTYAINFESDEYVFNISGRVFARNRQLAYPLREFYWRFHTDLASQREDYLVLRAGAVVWDGRAIVIPGLASVGKSRLIYSLVKLGCRYISDDFLLLDDAGLIRGDGRPLTLWGEADDPIDTKAGDIPAPVGLGWVFALSYSDSAAGADWKPMSVAQTVSELFEATIVRNGQPARCLEWIARATANARGWQGNRAEADDAAEQILRIVKEQEQ